MRISDWSSDVCSSDLPAFCSYRAWPSGLDVDLAADTGSGRRRCLGDLLDVLESGADRAEHGKLRVAGNFQPDEIRSAERRVGKECGSTVRSRGSTDI